MARIFFRKNCHQFLVDPLHRQLLLEVEDGLAPQGHPEQHYPIEDGIIRLASAETRAASAAYEASCRAQGWPAPDEFAFRAAPRSAIEGWNPNYWKQRALSTAALWHFLESERRARQEIPLGPLGTAAVISEGLPYVAYGLDVGGFFITLAAGPHDGPYSLGVLPQTRYCRAQLDLANLPLRPAYFDLVVFTATLPSLPPALLPQTLAHAVAALKAGGHLVITDVAETAALLRLLAEHPLRLESRPVTDREANRLQRTFRSLRRQTLTAPPLLIAQRR